MYTSTILSFFRLFLYFCEISDNKLTADWIFLCTFAVDYHSPVIMSSRSDAFFHDDRLGGKRWSYTY